MAQINPRTFADAKALGDNIYELILTNWGNRGMAQDQDRGSIAYPPVKPEPDGSVPILPILGSFTLPEIPSLSAIAIAPRSDLDRCILNFTSMPQTAPELEPPFVGFNAGFVERYGNMLATEQVLSVRAPLIGQLNGPIVVRASPEHWFGDHYIPDGTNTAQAFGTAIKNTPVNPDRPVWINPELRLLLYLTGKGALPPPVRAPFHQERVHVFQGAIEELLIVVPVMGRKFVRVSYRSGGDQTVQITGTFHTLFRPGILGDIPANDWEVPLIPPTLIPGDTAVAFTCDCNLVQPNISYLLIKATATVLQQARFTVDAYD
jgi:hypothetical protein